MAKRRPFYLYQRKKKHGSYWYVCYIDPETGKQMSAKSIDCLKVKLGMPDGNTVTHRDDACRIAFKALDAGLVFVNSSCVPFVSYCESFWNFDTSSYVRMRNHARPNSIGREYCINMLCNFRKHVASALDTGIALNSITVRHLETVIDRLFEKKLSSGTVQMVMLSFSIPLKEAFRQGLIVQNPASHLQTIQRIEKPRGVFSDDEVASILDAVKACDRNLASCIYLSLCTGMRSGEIRALRCSDIIPSYIDGYEGVKMDKVVISKSLAPYSGVKTTKGKYTREALLPHWMGELICRGKENGDLVVQGKEGGFLKPFELRKGFYGLLEKIGIDGNSRQERRLTFHSLRHYFSTFSADNDIGQLDRMAVLGHRSKEVNDRYTHVTDRQLVKASKVAVVLLGAEKSAEEAQVCNSF